MSRGKFRDLTGSVFGRLTVLAVTDKRIGGHPVYLCECSCEDKTKIEVSAKELKRKPPYGTKSCGCLKREFLEQKRLSLVGQKFNMLLVLAGVEDAKNAGRTLWRCVCDCGNEVLVYGTDLKNGHVKSCGCLREPSLIGRRFGMLVVIEETSERSGSCKTWKCLCDCGNTHLVSTSNLTGENVKSCGCLRKIIGDRVKEKTAKKYKYGAAFEQVYNSYIRRANKQGRDFRLNRDEFYSLTQMRCNYCGSIPEQIRNHSHNNHTFVYNGIDRVDNNEGYTSDNCVPCCGFCNTAKRNRSLEDFSSWLARIRGIKN